MKYTEYSTKYKYMSGMSLVAWMERSTYGSDVLSSTSNLFVMNLMYQGGYCRRNPDTEEILDAYNYVCVDFDHLNESIRFPPKFWRFAFEVDSKIPSEFQLDFRSGIKLFLASHEEKWVLKGPITLYFLLSYSKKPIQEISTNDFQEMEDFTKNFIKFHDLCMITEDNFGKSNYTLVCPQLRLKKTRILELLKFIKSPNFRQSPISKMIDEFWELKIDENFNYRWKNYFIRDDFTLYLIKKWSNHSRIKRSTKIGDPYYVDTNYSKYLDREDFADILQKEYTKWDSSSIEPLELPNISHLESFEDEKIDIEKDFSKHPIRGFLRFYKSQFNKRLEVVQANNGIVLCKETRKYHPKSILVKINTKDSLYRGYPASSHIMHTFLTGKSKEVLFFTYEPEAYIRQEGLDLIRDLHEIYTYKNGVFQYVLSYFAFLRNMHILDINLRFSGFLSDYSFQEQYYLSKRYLTNIQRFFTYNEQKQAFEEVPYDIEGGKKAYQNELDRKRKKAEERERKKKQLEKDQERAKNADLSWMEDYDHLEGFTEDYSSDADYYFGDDDDDDDDD